MEFLFISGTSLLVLTYREEEKFKAQGLNDFIVYLIHAITIFDDKYIITETDKRKFIDINKIGAKNYLLKFDVLITLFHYKYILSSDSKN